MNKSKKIVRNLAVALAASAAIGGTAVGVQRSPIFAIDGVKGNPYDGGLTNKLTSDNSETPVRTGSAVTTDDETSETPAEPTPEVPETTPFAYEMVDDTTLKITGSGAMPDYTSIEGNNPAPWAVAGFDHAINKIVISDGITSIGEHALDGIYGDNPRINVDVEIPASVTSISYNAFSGLQMDKLVLPSTVTSLAEDSLAGATIGRIDLLGTNVADGFTKAGIDFNRTEIHIHKDSDIADGIKQVLSSVAGINIVPDENICKEALARSGESYSDGDTFKCSICGFDKASENFCEVDYALEGLTLRNGDTDRYDVPSGKVKYDLSKPISFAKDSYPGYTLKQVVLTINGRTRTYRMASSNDSITIDSLKEIAGGSAKTASIVLTYAPKDIPIACFKVKGDTEDWIRNLRAEEGKITFPDYQNTDPDYIFNGWYLVGPDGDLIDTVLYKPGDVVSSVDFLENYANGDNQKALKVENVYHLRAAFIRKDAVNIAYRFSNGITLSNSDYQDSMNIDGSAELPSDNNVADSHDNFTLTGWNTSPDGKGKTFAPGEKVTYKSFDQKDIKNKTITLYAQWAVPQTIKVSFSWNDEDNRDDKRPETVTLKNTIQGSSSTTETREINTDRDISFIKPSKEYDSKTKKVSPVTVKIELDKNTDNNGYKFEIKKLRDNEYMVIGTYTTEKTDKKYNIIWDDAQNNDGIRPKTLTLQVADRDGVVTGASVNISGTENNTVVDFPALTKNAKGKTVNTFTPVLPKIDGYTLKLDEDKIMATHVPAEVTYNVKTVWDDYNNRNNKRPASYELALKGLDKTYNATIIGDKGTVPNVLKFKAGKPNDITVTVTNPTDYSGAAVVTRDDIKGVYNVTVTMKYIGIDVEPEKEIKPTTTKPKVKKNNTKKKNIRKNTKKGTTVKSSQKNTSKSSSVNSDLDKLLNDINNGTSYNDTDYNSADYGNHAYTFDTTGDGGTTYVDPNAGYTTDDSSAIDGVTTTPEDEENYRDIKVRLIWDDGKDDYHQNIVAVVKGSDSSEHSVFLTTDNGFKDTAFHLPIVYSDNKDITYKVVPDVPEGDVSHVYQDRKDPTLFTIVNRNAGDEDKDNSEYGIDVTPAETEEDNKNAQTITTTTTVTTSSSVETKKTPDVPDTDTEKPAVLDSVAKNKSLFKLIGFGMLAAVGIILGVVVMIKGKRKKDD